MNFKFGSEEPPKADKKKNPKLEKKEELVKDDIGIDMHKQYISIRRHHMIE